MATAFPKAERVKLGDVTLALYKAGPDPVSTDKPLVVFLHGWPELAYSWRHQMAALADAGYPVVAPDNRGYGKSDKPAAVKAYTGRELAQDCANIVAHMGRDKAVFVGHDWGALLLWMLPFYQPHCLLGCVGLNVPLFGRPPVDPMAMFRAAYGDDMYIVQFQQEGVGEPILEADLERTFRFFFRKPSADPDGKKALADGAFESNTLNLLALLQSDPANWGGQPLLSDADIAVYVDGYSDGFTAPLHWYRNFTSNWEDMAQFADADGKYPHVNLPCLQILADLDRACPPALAEGMEKRCSPCEIVTFEGCGHWTMQERPIETNNLILDWLSRHFTP